MAPRHQPPPNPPHTRVLLRRADQAIVAGLLLVGLIALAVYYIGHYTLGDGLIEIDLGNRRRIRVDAQVDPEALARVLDVLERR